MKIRKVILVFTISTLLGFLIYSYLYYSQFGEFPNYSENRNLLFFIFIGTNTIGFLVVWINAILNKILFWKQRTGLRFIIGLLINYFVILLIIYIGVFLYLQLAELNKNVAEILIEYAEIEIRVYILILVLDIFLVVFNFLTFSYKHYSQGQIQTAQLKRKQLELQFEALRTQLSPHYLFNSLNTISSLIYKDKDQTESYIRKLASTYQYILESDRKQLITLREEIDFIKDYCYLIKIRFGKAFKVYIDINKSYLEYYIPPMSIQILIENAVKHNVFDDDEPLEVDIINNENLIYVKNKILRSPDKRESFNIGLGNIRKRYEVFTDKKINIIKNEFFTVELPLLKTKANG